MTNGKNWTSLAYPRIPKWIEPIGYRNDVFMTVHSAHQFYKTDPVEVHRSNNPGKPHEFCHRPRPNEINLARSQTARSSTWLQDEFPNCAHKDYLMTHTHTHTLPAWMMDLLRGKNFAPLRCRRSAPEYLQGHAAQQT
eukprot:2916063-Amphidinium_carterae.2